MRRLHPPSPRARRVGPGATPRPSSTPALAAVLAALVLGATVLVTVVPASGQADPGSGPAAVDADVARAVTAAGSAPLIVEVQPDTPTAPGTEARDRESREVVADVVDVDEVDVVATIAPRVVLTADEDELDRLRNTPGVTRISLNRAHRPTLTDAAADVEVPAVWATGVKGQGQTIAVFDSGIDATHPFFAGSVTTEACFSSDTSITVSLCPLDGTRQPVTAGPGSAAPCAVVDPSLSSSQRSRVEAQCAHGTHVAGIAAGGPGGSAAAASGIAPAASIIAVQVFSYSPADKSIVAMDADLLAAFDWLRSNAPPSLAALNLSLGGPASPLGCTTDVLRPSIVALTDAGVAVVAASGNAGSKTSIASPGCIPEAIAVGAVDTTSVGAGWTVPYFSSSGPGLDLLAPGVDVTSSFPGGRYGPNTGTSMATPFVTGAIALVRQARPTAPVGQSLLLLQRSGRNVTDLASGRSTPVIQVADALAGLAPFGAYDGASAGPGTVTVTGWAIDPDTVGAVPVEVRVDGVTVASGTATVDRADVGAAYPGYGGAHGFATTVSAGPGTRQVCVTARNDVPAGPSTPLGCRTVTVPTGSPFGWLEQAAPGAPGSVVVSGWTIDPDRAAPIDVHVYVDGVFAGLTTAAGTRGDVAAVYPGYGANHGYSLTVPASGGTREVCAWGINVGAGSNRLLGCRSLTLPGGSPSGSLDAAPTVPGGITVQGWALDRDTAAPIDVHVYVDGTFAASRSANTLRTDIAAAFPGYGPDHGFDITVGAGGGTHRVCVFGIDVGIGSNALIGCRTVVVPGGNPFGSLDAAVGGAGRATVSGWTIDPDTTAPIDVHVYVDGAFAGLVTAGSARPDVGNVFPVYGPNHGYGVTVPAARGTRQVCVWAIDVGVGTNPLIGCRTVTVT